MWRLIKGAACTWSRTFKVMGHLRQGYNAAGEMGAGGSLLPERCARLCQLLLQHHHLRNEGSTALS